MEREPVSTPALHAIGMRRRLLGIPLVTLAAQAGITPGLLQAVEDGQVSADNLHLAARKTLAKVLDITL